MRKLRIIIFIGAVSAVSGSFLYSLNGEQPSTRNNSNAKTTTLKLIQIPAPPHQQEILGSKSNPETVELTVDQAKNNTDLLPHEVAIWDAWAEARGYDLNGNLTASYNSLSDDVLLSLAAQNDPRAHYILAGRMLSTRQAISTEIIPAETIAKIENHLQSASVLGYTSTLNVLCELALRRANIENSTNKEMIMSAYKFALTSVRRGDQNSESLLASLKSAVPISDEDYAAVLEKSVDFYSELSKKRDAIGLPPFNDETPPEILAFTMRAK